jgi:hypothetical protein
MGHKRKLSFSVEYSSYNENLMQFVIPRLFNTILEALNPCPVESMKCEFDTGGEIVTVFASGTVSSYEEKE